MPYNLKEELERISKAINSSEARNITQFKQYYDIMQRHFGGRTGEWVRFNSQDEFKEAVKALLYVTMFYSSFVTKNQGGLSEHTGYTTDGTHTYSWWRIHDPGIGNIILDDRNFDTEEALFDLRQPIARMSKYYDVRLRIKEITETPLIW